MPECSPPLLRPLACAPRAASFSSTTLRAAGWRTRSSRASARPTIPAPTTTKSALRPPLTEATAARRGGPGGCAGPGSEGARDRVERDGDAQQGGPESHVVVRVSRPSRHDELIARLQAHLVERAALAEGEAQRLPLQDALARPLDAHLVELGILGRPARGRERVRERRVGGHEVKARLGAGTRHRGPDQRPRGHAGVLPEGRDPAGDARLALPP